MKPRKRKCKNCGEWIESPRSTLQVACSARCALAINKAKAEKNRREETREMRKELMPHREWLNLLQKVFNTYIRKRDKAKGCISCGRAFHGKYDAGHFFSVGSHPELRFDEDNVHGQCVYCNRDKHGNLIEYAERLPQRIGEYRYEALKARRGQNNKLSIPEIERMIEEYRAKTKALS